MHIYTGDDTFYTLRRTNCLHLIPEGELDEKYKQFKCPAALADSTQCTNIVNPQQGFCTRHLGNCTGSSLSVGRCVKDHVNNLFSALEFPDDSLYVKNALSSAADLFQRCQQNMQTGYAVKEAYDNAHIMGLGQAAEQTHYARKAAQRIGGSAEKQWNHVMSLPPVPTSNALLSNSSFMERISSNRAAARALPPGQSAAPAIEGPQPTPPTPGQAPKRKYNDID